VKEAAVKNKQEAIMQATLDLIAERGLNDTPMSLVAKHSGVSAGIIYHYFESKDALVRELYCFAKAEFSRALLEHNPQALLWPDQFKQIWRNAYAFFVSHPRETNFLEQCENSPYYNFEQVLEYDQNMQMMVEIIMRNFQQGHIRQMPLEVLYDLTLGVALSLAKRRIKGTVTLDDNELEAIAEACCRSIQI
jgi:AcrR family transcriptional regulator